MKKILLILLGLSLYCNALISQTQTLRGMVVDTDSKTPLIGATIFLQAAQGVGTTTDATGQFELIKVPIGRQDFVVQYVGYEPQVLSQLLITPSREVVVEINLKESILKLEEVEVRASAHNHQALNEMSMISARSMTMEELNRQPATLYDPARMALSFPGVGVGEDDFINEIVVRGNSPRGVLWRLEGVEIHSPNHFGELGSAGGGISMLSTNAMGTSDFFAGAFPAEYGNALSGVFDIKLRNGNTKKREVSLQAGIMGIEGLVEGPIKKGYDGSYLVNYRYSTLGLIEKIGILQDFGAPVFQDLSFKVKLPTSKFGTFNLFGVAGIAGQTSLSDGTTPDNDTAKGTTSIFGAAHLYNLSPKTYLKTVFVNSRSKMEYSQWFGFDGIKNGQGEETQNFTDIANRVALLLNHKFNSRHTLRVGGTYGALNYDLTFNTRDKEIIGTDMGFTVNYLDTWTTYLDSKGKGKTLQSYLQWKYHIASNLTLNTGLHFLYFGVNKETSIEPRCGLNWQFSPKQSLAFGIGKHSRVEALAAYFAEQTDETGAMTQLNKDLGLQNAHHYILAYELAISKNLNFKIEGYYQTIDQLAISNNPNSTRALLNDDYFDLFFEDYNQGLVANGKGRNYGVDISIEKGLHNGTYFIANTSIFKSEYQTATKEWWDTKFSNNYNVALIGGKEFQFRKHQHKTIGINAKLLANGGKRYTPIDRTASNAAEETIYARPYSKNLPAYFRADAGIYYRWFNKKQVTQTISLNIQNVTNRNNVYSKNEYYAGPAGFQEFFDYQEGLFPVIHYRIEF